MVKLVVEVHPRFPSHSYTVPWISHIFIGFPWPFGGRRSFYLHGRGLSGGLRATCGGLCCGAQARGKPMWGWLTAPSYIMLYPLITYIHLWSYCHTKNGISLGLAHETQKNTVNIPMSQPVWSSCCVDSGTWAGIAQWWSWGCIRRRLGASEMVNLKNSLSCPFFSGAIIGSLAMAQHCRTPHEIGGFHTIWIDIIDEFWPNVQMKSPQNRWLILIKHHHPIHFLLNILNV